MIGFKINNEWLDLPPTINIPIEWESGMFSDDISLSGIATMPFSFPFTDKNRRLLKHFDMVSNKLKNVKLDCEIHLAGNFWTKGTLTVIARENSQMFDCDFSEVSNLIDMAEKKLADILKDDVIRIIGPYRRVWHMKLNATSASFSIRINSFYIHYVVSNSTIANATNDLYDHLSTDADFLKFFDVSIETIGAETIINIEMLNDDTISINPIIFFACFDILFDTTAYGTVVDWAVYQIDGVCSVIDGNVDNTYSTVPFCFPMIKNDVFYSTYNAQYTSVGKIINHYELGYSNNKNSSSAFKRSISPQFFLFYVLEKIAGLQHITISGDFTEVEEFKNRCFIYNNFALDLWMNNEAHNNGGTDIWNVFSSIVHTKNHLPDITFAELLKIVKTFFGVSIIPKHNTLKFNLNKNILLSSDVIDWTDRSFKYLEEIIGCFEDGYKLLYEIDSSDSYLSDNIKDIVFKRKEDVATYADLPQYDVERDEIRLVIDQQKFYRAKINDFPAPINWVYWSCNLGDYIYLKGKTDINTNDSPTVNDNWIESLSSTSSRKVYIPHIYQTGSSPLTDLGFNPAPPRLLLYWGKKSGKISTGETTDEHTGVRSHSFVNGVTGDASEYPLASIDNFDMNGNQLGDYALRFDGPYGLYENFHKDWFAFRNQAKKITIKIILSTNDLLQLELTKKIQIKENQYLIHKVRGTVQPISNKIECIVELYKL